jgi:Ca2+-binding EF-hand superfamily protein
MISFQITSREEKEGDEETLKTKTNKRGRHRQDITRSKTSVHPIDQAVDQMILECSVSFTERQRAIIQTFFELHDADWSHSLSLAELLKVVDEIGRAPPTCSKEFDEFCRLLQAHDVDDSGELDFEEFMVFLAEYYRVVYASLFLKCDKDKSGEIDRAELKGLTILLKEQGFHVRGEDMADMFRTIDASGIERLDWPKFCEFMTEYRNKEFELLNEGAGFKGIEVDYLSQVFRSADVDNSGQLEISEVLELLETKMLKSVLDSRDEIKKIATLFTRIDKDKSMSLDQLEFLKLLRVWITNSDHSHQSIIKVFRGGNEHSATFEATRMERKGSKTLKIQAAAAAAGHFDGELDAANIEEIRRTSVQHDMEACILAEQWNLSVQEVRCLQECFEFCDIDASGWISPVELKPLLKTLGFTPCTATQKRAFSKVSEDAQFCSDLDIQSLVKFLVMYHEACANEVLQTMKREGHKDGVHVDKLVQALYQVGQYMNKDGALALLKSVGGDPESNVVDCRTFEKMLAADRCNRTFEWRKRCGFTEEQLNSIQKAFSSHCNEVKGMMMERDGRVLDALQLLNLKPGPEKRQALLIALIRLDRAGDGTISFQDFLLLVRHLNSQNNAQRGVEEKAKAEIAGLDSENVQQIRQVFMDYGPDVTGELPMNKVQKMMFDLGVIKNSNDCHQWKSIMLQIVGKGSSVSFANLLDVLHRLEVARKG